MANFLLLLSICLTLFTLLNVIRHFIKKGQFKLENRWDKYTIYFFLSAILLLAIICIKSFSP